MKLTTRHLIRGKGGHRRRPAADIVPLAAFFPPAPETGVVTQAFRDCPSCGAETAAVLHRDSHTCGDCGHTHHPEDGTE